MIKKSDPSRRSNDDARATARYGHTLPAYLDKQGVSPESVVALVNAAMQCLKMPHRVRIGISEFELAKIMRVSPATVHRWRGHWKTGRIYYPNLAEMSFLTDAAQGNVELIECLECEGRGVLNFEPRKQERHELLRAIRERELGNHAFDLLRRIYNGEAWTQEELGQVLMRAEKGK